PEYLDSQPTRSARSSRQRPAYPGLLSSLTLVITCYQIALLLSQPGQTLFHASQLLLVPLRPHSRCREVFRHGQGLLVTPILTQDISRYAVTIRGWVNRTLHRA